MPLKTPRLSRCLVQLGKEPFDGIEPGGRGRSEVEVEPRMPFQPCSYLGMLMGGVVGRRSDGVPAWPGFRD
jgi:hypothetical protein